MEEQLSLLDLVLHASFTVQMVMVLLVLASMMSWYMIVNRFIYFRNAREELYQFEERFWSGVDLSQLYREGNEKAADGQAMLGMESIFRGGFKEFSRLAQQSEMASEAVIEGSAVPCASLPCARKSDWNVIWHFLLRWALPAPMLVCSVLCGALCIPSAALLTQPRPHWPR